jgi:hypothetical protein
MYSIEKLQPVNTHCTPLRMKALHAPQWHSATKDKQLQFFYQKVYLPNQGQTKPISTNSKILLTDSQHTCSVLKMCMPS